MGMEYISAGKLDYYADRKDCIIVDLRSPLDYKRGHIKGAVNIQYSVIDKRVDSLFKEKANTLVFQNNVVLSSEKIVVFYCDRGSRSLAICGRLAQFGFDVKTVVGGIRQYRGKKLVRG